MAREHRAVHEVDRLAVPGPSAHDLASIAEAAAESPADTWRSRTYGVTGSSSIVSRSA